MCVCRYLYQCCWSNSDNAGVGSCGCLREEELVVMLHDLQICQSVVPHRPALASGASQSSAWSTLEVVVARQPRPSRDQDQSPRTRLGGRGLQTSTSPVLHNTLTIIVKLLVAFEAGSDYWWSVGILNDLEVKIPSALCLRPRQDRAKVWLIPRQDWNLQKVVRLDDYSMTSLSFTKVSLQQRIKQTPRKSE